MRQGCRAGEIEFMKRNLNTVRDRSGSCAVILLVTPSKVYCANVGDSRAIMSQNFGTQMSSITEDHKPSEINEKNRVIRGGGKVYQSNAMNAIRGGPPILGPMRVMPGRLSVSVSSSYCCLLICLSFPKGFKKFWRLHGQDGKIRRQP